VTGGVRIKKRGKSLAKDLNGIRNIREVLERKRGDWEKGRIGKPEKKTLKGRESDLNLS